MTSRDSSRLARPPRRADGAQSMNRRAFTIGLAALGAGACAGRTPKSTASNAQRRSVRGDLVFITREGCVNTPDMLLNLDEALRALGLALDHEVVDLGKLPKNDARI